MKVTLEQIAEALEKNGGFITQAAKQLGVSYQAVQQRIKKSATLQKKLHEIRERYLDIAESKLVALINERNLGAICFFLKCKGKDRGYVERQEITGKDGGELKFKVTRK